MKIYFDMDGVLVDFEHGARNVYQNFADLNHPSEELSPEQREAKRQCWLKIEQQGDFWCNLPVMNDAEQLLGVAKSVGEIFILSKTPSAKHFVNGEKYVQFVADEKRKWVLKHLGKFFDDEHIIICNGKKGALAKPMPEDVLIDDRCENINEWESCGGRGILFVNSIDSANKLKNLNV